MRWWWWRATRAASLWLSISCMQFEKLELGGKDTKKPAPEPPLPPQHQQKRPQHYPLLEKQLILELELWMRLFEGVQCLLGCFSSWLAHPCSRSSQPPRLRQVQAMDSGAGITRPRDKGGRGTSVASGVPTNGLRKTTWKTSWIFALWCSWRWYATGPTRSMTWCHDIRSFQIKLFKLTLNTLRLTNLSLNFGSSSWRTLS
jgi:hypothetical protein